MRYSLAKAAAVTFLGLAGIFLGANGAPSGLAPNTREVSSYDIAKRVDSPSTSSPRIPVAQLKASGYDLERTYETGDMGWIYTVKKGNSLINELGVDPASNLIAVRIAFNGADRASPATRLSWRGILLSTWTQVSHSDVRSLKTIVFTTIQKTEIQASINEAFAHGKDPSSTSERVKPTDSKAFHELMYGNAFGIGISKMLVEYLGMEGRSVLYIDISRGPSSYKMIFHLS